MNQEKIKMNTQLPKIRNKNFQEVELGYTKEEAQKEASRCLHCKIPKCVEGCPVNIMIPDFIAAIKAGYNINDTDLQNKILSSHNLKTLSSFERTMIAKEVGRRI